MAQEAGPLHMFHIYRLDGSPIFLHPFDNAKNSMELLESRELTGRYGNEPQVESLTSFRNRLYEIIERDVKSWIADVRFIPRFLISAGVFLGAYILLSTIVRDPLPMIDEIAISIGAALATYLVVGRRDLQSEAAMKKRIALRKKVDGIVFTESEFLCRVEEMLQEQESASTDSVLRSMDWYVDEDLVRQHESQARQLVSYLEQRFADSVHRGQGKKLLRRSNLGDVSERERGALKKWIRSKRVDLPLFALYLELRRSLPSHTDVTADP